MLGRFFGWIFGVPGTAKEREDTFLNIVGAANTNPATQPLRYSIHHNTKKAGALLAAQGVFMAADTLNLRSG